MKKRGLLKLKTHVESNLSSPFCSVKTGWEWDSSLRWAQVRQHCNYTLLPSIIWLLDLPHIVNEGLDFYKSFLLHEFIRILLRNTKLIFMLKIASMVGLKPDELLKKTKGAGQNQKCQAKAQKSLRFIAQYLFLLSNRKDLFTTLCCN